MLYGESLVTPPEQEPISLPEAKQHLRYLAADQDSKITGLISAARIVTEALTRLQLVTSTWLFTFDMFPWLYPLWGGTVSRPPQNILYDGTLWLPRPPLQSVGMIQYVDPGGVLQTWDPSLYLVDAIQRPARITPQYGVPWPITRYVTNAVQITLTCGFGQPSDVPEAAKAAMLWMIGTWYEDRSYSGTMAELPWHLQVLLNSIKPGSYVN